MEDTNLISESTATIKSYNETNPTEEYKRPFQCPTCGVRFGSEENLESHKIIHQSDGIIKCRICDKHFDTVTGLMAHNIVHTEKKFKCQLCDVWFKTSGNMKEHMKVHKGLVFKCSFCGKDFNKIGNLRLHEKRHTKTLPQFHCDLCPRIFTQKCLLKYHMRTHNGDRPYKCSACDSAFADKSNLRKHFRIHSGEKPFQCDKCDKSFNQKSSLTCHKRTHVTFKPHECQHCGKRFGLIEELIVHLRVHGEIRKFKCSICDDEFFEHCYLKSHMRIHDLKTAGNKSVQVFKSADINTEEPTCLVSVNGDANTLESVVLRKRPKLNKRRYRRRRIKPESEKKSNNDSTVKIKRKRTKRNSTVSDHQFQNSAADCNFSAITDDLKTEIKQEVNVIDETTIPFVDVSIKVEPGDFTFNYQDNANDDSTDHSNFDFGTQSFNSDSEDEKPIIQRLDMQHRMKNRVNPMDKYKDIIESSFPIVLVERLQYSGIESVKLEIKCEAIDVDQSNGLNNERKSRSKVSKSTRKKSKDKKTTTGEAQKHQPTSTADDQNYIYKCSYCPKLLKTWANVIMHEQIHRKTFDCPTCECHCSNVMELIKHAKESPDCSRKTDTTFMCTICSNGIVYRNKTSFDYHLTKHSGLRPFICDICKKTFRSKETVRMHMKRHESVQDFNCEVCGRGFPNKNHLQQHQLSHTDEKPFKCDICNNFFKSQGRLYNHKKIHMKPEYSCQFCSRQFTIAGNLKIHEMRHMRDDLVDKFKCEVCDKEFILKHDLKYHMRKHNGERPYACTLCPSRFADISNLHKHTKIHTGAKPYVCHCGKSYNQQSSLNTHKKTHLVASLVEKYFCTHCPKKYALEEDLTLHLRSHGINSMFKCNFCDKEYELLNHLRSHRRIHLNLKQKRTKFLWPEKITMANDAAGNDEAIKVDLNGQFLKC